MDGNSRLLETVNIIACSQDAFQQRNAIDSLRLADRIRAPAMLQSILQLVVSTLDHLKIDSTENSVTSKELPRILLVLAQAAWTNASHDQNAVQTLIEFTLSLLPGGKLWKNTVALLDWTNELHRNFINQFQALVVRAHRHLFPHMAELMITVLKEYLSASEDSKAGNASFNHANLHYVGFAAKMIRTQLQRKLPIDHRLTQTLISSTDLIPICVTGFTKCLQGAYDADIALLWIDLYYDLLANKLVYSHFLQGQCHKEFDNLLIKNPPLSNTSLAKDSDCRVLARGWFHMYRLISFRPAYFVHPPKLLADIHTLILQPLLKREPSFFSAERLLCLSQIFKCEEYGWRSGPTETTRIVRWNQYEPDLVELLLEIDAIQPEDLLPDERVVFSEMDGMDYEDTDTDFDGDQIKRDLFESAILRESFKGILTVAAFCSRLNGFSAPKVGCGSNVLVNVCLRELIRDVHQIPMDQIIDFISTTSTSAETLLLLSELADNAANEVLQDRLTLLAENKFAMWEQTKQLLSEMKEYPYVPFVVKYLRSSAKCALLVDTLITNLVKSDWQDNHAHHIAVLVDAISSLTDRNASETPGLLTVFKWFSEVHTLICATVDSHTAFKIITTAVLKASDRASSEGNLKWINDSSFRFFVDIGRFCFLQAVDNASHSQLGPAMESPILCEQWISLACSICLTVLSARNGGYTGDSLEFNHYCCAWLRKLVGCNTKLPMAALYLTAEIRLRTPNLVEDCLVREIFLRCNKESFTNWTLLSYCGKELLWSLNSSLRPSPEVQVYVQIILLEYESAATQHREALFSTLKNQLGFQSEEGSLVEAVLRTARCTSHRRRISRALDLRGQANGGKNSGFASLETVSGVTHTNFALGTWLGGQTGLIIPLDNYFFCGALYGCEVPVRESGSIGRG